MTEPVPTDPRTEVQSRRLRLPGVPCGPTPPALQPQSDAQPWRRGTTGDHCAGTRTPGSLAPAAAALPRGGPWRPRPPLAPAPCPRGLPRPRGARPTMRLLSPRRALLPVYCPQIFLLLSGGSYL